MSAAPARHPRPIAPAPSPSKPRPNQPRPNQPRPNQPRPGQLRTAPSARAVPSRGSQPKRRTQGNSQPGRRDHLRAVAAPEQARSLVPFAWTCALIVIGALGAVLLVNTSMASGAYERRDLKIEIANLHEQRSALVTQLEQKSSPDQLGADAQALGMQPAQQFGFISLGDTIVIESGSK